MAILGAGSGLTVCRVRGGCIRRSNVVHRATRYDDLQLENIASPKWQGKESSAGKRISSLVLVRHSPVNACT